MEFVRRFDELLARRTAEAVAADILPFTTEIDRADGTFTAIGAGGQYLTVIPRLETVIVNLVNTDQGLDSARIEWDSLLVLLLSARLR